MTGFLFGIDQCRSGRHLHRGRHNQFLAHFQIHPIGPGFDRVGQQLLHQRRVRRVRREIGPFIICSGGHPDDVAMAERLGGDGGIARCVWLLLAGLTPVGAYFRIGCTSLPCGSSSCQYVRTLHQIQPTIFDAAETIKIFVLDRVGLEVEAE